MRNFLFLLSLLFAPAMPLEAQHISRTFRSVPLPEALKALNDASGRYRIFFIYDELEDFTVTTDIIDRSIPDAVRDVIGFYPMRVTFGDSIISVECTRKEQEKLMGRVVDDRGRPVEFANITLLGAADSCYITGGVSNANGDFVIPCDVRRVLVKVTFVGYKTFYKIYNVGEAGTIRLVPEAIMLGDVTVRSVLPKTQIRHDAMVTTVAGTILEKTGTAEDLLGHIPMVDVSNGSVEVFGRGTAEIYVNGRKLHDNAELQQILSENVQNVEVVNNPGARYNASAKAVIRIRIKRQRGEGFGFTETSELRYDRGWNGWQEQVDMNYRRGGLDISGRILGKKTAGKESFANVIDTYLTNHWHQEARSTKNNETVKGMVMAQANYMVNDSNSMGVRYEFARVPCGKLWGTFSSSLSQDGMIVENNESRIAVTDRGYNHGVNAYYNGKIGGWDIDFNADGLWSETKGYTDSDETTRSETVSDDKRNMRTEKINRNTLFAAKIVAGHCLAGGKVCFGGEVSANTRHNDYTDEMGLTISDKSRVSESIVAGFAEYRCRINCVEAVAGLRCEHVASDYYLYGVRQDGQSRSYTDLFPSLSLSTRINRLYMQLSCSNDITRPAYSDLSSAVTYINRYTYEGGNPHLRPVYTRSVVLGVAYSWWVLSVGYKHVRDNIVRTFKPYGENPSIAYSYIDNMGAYGMFFCALSASPEVGNVWYPRITVGMQAQDYVADTPWGSARFNRPQMTVKWNNTVKLPWKLRFEAKLDFTTCGDNTVTRIRKSYLWSSVTLRRDFLSDRLNVQVKATDPFRMMSAESEVYSASHVFRGINDDARCVVVIKAVYKFNAVRDKYKGKGAGNSEKSRL